MNNLGGYQVMTTVAKKVGGPKHLLLYTAIGGYAVIRFAEQSVKQVVKKFNLLMEEQKPRQKVYTVKEFGITDEGINFYPDDKFKVLFRDKKSAVIVFSGEEETSYEVSMEFLRDISDYDNGRVWLYGETDDVWEEIKQIRLDMMWILM